MLYLCAPAAILTGGLEWLRGESRREAAIAIALGTLILIIGWFTGRGGCEIVIN